MVKVGMPCGMLSVVHAMMYILHCNHHLVNNNDIVFIVKLWMVPIYDDDGTTMTMSTWRWRRCWWCEWCGDAVIVMANCIDAIGGRAGGCTYRHTDIAGITEQVAAPRRVMKKATSFTKMETSYSRDVLIASSFHRSRKVATLASLSATQTSSRHSRQIVVVAKNVLIH